MNTSKNKITINAFQGLRGISHCDYFVYSRGYNPLRWFGACGVVIFAMLSGYLVLYKNYNASMNNFSIVENIKRKVKKFYPLHFFTFLFAVPLSVMIFDGNTTVEIAKVVSNLLLIQAWIPDSSFYFSYNSVSWYLTLTIFFVFMTPFIVKVLKKLNCKMLIITTIGIVIFQTLLVVLMHKYSIAHWIIYICPLTRTLDFILGGIVFALVHSFKEKNISGTIINIGLFINCLVYLALLGISLKSISEYFSVVVWSLPTFSIMVLLTLKKEYNVMIRKLLFENKFIIFMGNISFEVFLIHALCISYAKLLCEKFNYGIHIYTYIFAIVFSIIISATLYILRKRFSLLKRGMR